MREEDPGVLRWLGLASAVGHRARAEWPVVLAAFVLLLTATTLLAAGVLYGDTVALSGLRRAVLEHPPADRSILVRTSSTPADLAATDAAVRDGLARALRDVGGEVSLVVRAGTVADRTTPAADVHDLLLVSSFEHLDAHASLVDGRWPTAGASPIEATLSEGAARSLGLAVGSRLSLVSRLDASRTLDVVLVGIWRPDPTDAYWLGDPLELTGVQPGDSFTTHGPLALTQADLLAQAAGGSVDLQWRGLPDIDGLRLEALGAVSADVTGLSAALHGTLPPDRDVTVSTELPSILDSIGRSVLVSRSGVLLLTAQFAVLAGYAVLLVAGMLVERRRPEAALLRSRGAGTSHLASMALLEALLIAVPAAFLAPFLAVGVVRLVGAIGPLAEAGIASTVVLEPAVVAVAVLAAAFGVLALVLPTLGQGGTVSGVRAAIARQTSRTLPQRLGIDLALVVLAAIALWQLRLYGAPLTRDARGALGLDPLLVAAPAIGLVAGAILAIRIVPRIAEIAERLLDRRPGLVPSLGARQLARRPLRYTRSALLLMLAAALGTFAVAHAATWTRSQSDQAAYQSAADLRVVQSEYATLPAWAVGPVYRAIPGVATATPVEVQSLDIGRAVRGGQLLAVDPATVGSLVAFPPEDAGDEPQAVLGQLVSARPSSPAVALPDGAVRLAVTVDAALAVPPADGPLDPSEPPGSLSLSVVIADGDGRLHRIDGAEGALTGPGQRLEVPLTVDVGGRPVSPRGPLRLESIELVVSAPTFHAVVGTLDLTGVAASTSPTGEAWTPVALDPGAAGWSWLRVDPTGFSGPTTSPYLPAGGDAGRITLEPDLGPTSGAVVGDPQSPGTTFRLFAAPAGDTAVPAIVSRSFLEQAGIAVGDVVGVTSFGEALTLHVVGVLDAIPPVPPDTPAVVVDAASLDLHRFADVGQVATAREWWLGVEPGRAPDVVAGLEAVGSDIDHVIGRQALTDSLTSDPVPLGLIGALGLGAIAAMAFAAIGFVVSATVSTSERLGEFALLQALGLSRGQLSSWLSLEHVFLLLTGLVAGSVLGLLLAWLVLPFATLTATGAAAVPAPVVVIPWAALVPLWVLAAIVLVLTVVVTTRQLAAVQLAGVLRARDE